MQRVRAMGLFARLFSWFRPTRSVSAVNGETASSVAVVTPEPDVDVALVESDLFEPEKESAPNQSGFRMRALRGDATRKMPALETRASPFDAPTRRVDLDEIARTLDARAASSRK
jgi:hypothetical protein